jgi:ParB family chromosome partitioning protein
LTVFVATWEDLAGWWAHYDAAEVGAALSDEQWVRFEQIVAGTVAFAEAARLARNPPVEHIA